MILSVPLSVLSWCCSLSVQCSAYGSCIRRGICRGIWYNQKLYAAVCCIPHRGYGSSYVVHLHDAITNNEEFLIGGVLRSVVFCR